MLAESVADLFNVVRPFRSDLMGIVAHAQNVLVAEENVSIS